MNDILHNPARAYTALILLAAMGVVSSIVLYGWATGSFPLTTFMAGTASMKVNSAIGFLVLMTGVLGIWLRKRRLVTGCGLAVMVLGTFTVLEYVLGWGSGLDELFFADPWTPVHPGRMAAGTAVSFVLGGAMLAVHDTYPHSHINRYDILLTAFLAIPLFVFFSYVFAPDEVVNTPALGTMPLHSCLNFLFFFFAIALLTTSKGAAGLLNRNTRNARNFRWLFLIVLILPLCLGSVLNHGVQQKWIGPGVGIAIFCLFCTLIIASALAHHTILLDHWFRQLLQERRRSSQLKNQIHELLEISADAIFLFDDHLNILHANSGAQRILGFSPEELRAMTVVHLLPESGRGDTEHLMRQYLQREPENSSLNLPDRLQLQHKNGAEVPVAVTFSKKVQEDQILVIALVKSIEKLDDKIRSLEKKASTDPLTKAENRREFEDFCQRINLHALRKSDFTFCVMMLDIDNFKVINDSYGHKTGDVALAEFSRTVQHTLRDGDRLFRTGGEEFVVISVNVPPEDALAFGDRVRQAVEEHEIAAGDVCLRLTCSIGICVVDSSTADLEDAVQRADQAMYRAKRKGKNCCEMATPGDVAADENP
jgi:diguanylate cyclase (GGDEF)-like protein/PAS domain S-box-containing protein